VPAYLAPTRKNSPPTPQKRQSYKTKQKQIEDRDFEAAAEALESGGGGAGNALEEASQLARRACCGAVHVAVAARTPADGRNSATTGEGNGGGEGKATAVEAELRFELPPGYPFAQSAPARCRAACDALPRRALDSLSETLQSVADASAADGRGECLHELVAALEEGVQSALAAAAAVGAEEALALLSLSPQQRQQELAGQQVASDSAAGLGQPSADGGGGSGTAASAPHRRRRRVVLRLAHMRDRAGYLRTMRRWAKELGLAGLRARGWGGERVARRESFFRSCQLFAPAPQQHSKLKKLTNARSTKRIF
jgi:hypothetical protein